MSRLALSIVTGLALIACDPSMSSVDPTPDRFCPLTGDQLPVTGDQLPDYRPWYVGREPGVRPRYERPR